MAFIDLTVNDSGSAPVPVPASSSVPVPVPASIPKKPAPINEFRKFLQMKCSTPQIGSGPHANPNLTVYYKVAPSDEKYMSLTGCLEMGPQANLGIPIVDKDLDLIDTDTIRNIMTSNGHALWWDLGQMSQFELYNFDKDYLNLLHQRRVKVDVANFLTQLEGEEYSEEHHDECLEGPGEGFNDLDWCLVTYLNPTTGAAYVMDFTDPNLFTTVPLYLKATEFFELLGYSCGATVRSMMSTGGLFHPFIYDRSDIMSGVISDVATKKTVNKLSFISLELARKIVMRLMVIRDYNRHHDVPVKECEKNFVRHDMDDMRLLLLQMTLTVNKFMMRIDHHKMKIYEHNFDLNMLFSTKQDPFGTFPSLVNARPLHCFLSNHVIHPSPSSASYQSFMNPVERMQYHYQIMWFKTEYAFRSINHTLSLDGGNAEIVSNDSIFTVIKKFKCELAMKMFLEKNGYWPMYLEREFDPEAPFWNHRLPYYDFNDINEADVIPYLKKLRIHGYFSQKRCLGKRPRDAKVIDVDEDVDMNVALPIKKRKLC